MTSLSLQAYAPYDSPVDYIERWTDRIWEDRGIGEIRLHYAPDALVHGAYGTIRGSEQVIRASLMKKASFPTRSFAHEDVVWEPRGGNGFISSHRIIQSGPMEGGPWMYGSATLREAVSRNIALCLIRDGVMVEEWVVRDEYAVVEQLGFDPNAVARSLAFQGNERLLGESETGAGMRPAPSDPLTSGQSGPRHGEHRDECELVMHLFEYVWNQRLLNLVPQICHRNVICHSSRARTVTRILGYQRELERLLAPFPDGRIEVHDVASNESSFFGTRVSFLWKLKGTYCGIPAYGPLTYSPIEILGASHFLLRDGQIFREWRVYDEIAVLAQLARARGDEPSVKS